MGAKYSYKWWEQFARQGNPIPRKNKSTLVQVSELCQVTVWFVEVRDSRTGYLLPVRDAQGTLPDVESCWDVTATAPRRPVSQSIFGRKSLYMDRQSVHFCMNCIRAGAGGGGGGGGDGDVPTTLHIW